jgi:hypothetical protein
MGGIRSVITPEYEDKKLVVAVAPTMSYTWFEPILRLTGADGMLPLHHATIQKEMMHNATRDIIVIPGGFVETNTGNEEFSTMDDSKWAYWLLLCSRHGYDVSFQWIYGATQIYHTGTYGMTTRLFLGRMGIPCTMPPRGKYGTFLAHNDVGMTICSFRMSIPHRPDMSRTSQEFISLLHLFKQRVSELLAKYSPAADQAPVRVLSSL